MPISKGEEWGSAGRLAPDAPVARNDREAASLVGGTHPVIGVESGDLARTLGIRQPYDRTQPKQLLPTDAIEVRLDDGSTHVAIAHAVIGTPGLHNHVVAVMNAAFVDVRNIAPRAHPGDGKVDVVTMRLSIGDRLKAWRRMRTASHLPHPGIDVARRSAGTIDMGRKRTVRLDRRRIGRSQTMHYEVVPNAIVIAAS